MESFEETPASQTVQVQVSSGRCRRCGGGEEFGVAVDLSRFYADERAHVLTRACGARRVRWLAARVARALRLPPPARLALLAGGRLVPPRDRLRLLRAPPGAGAPPPALQLIPIPEHWCGQEGLQGINFTNHADEIDAPATEVSCSTRMENDPQHCDSEMRQEFDMQTDQIRLPECESESQVNASSELQRVKQRALELLEHCAPPSAGAGEGAGQGAVERARRPRVRRRRRRRVPAASTQRQSSPAVGKSPPAMDHSPPVMPQPPPAMPQSPPVMPQPPPAMPQSPPVMPQPPPAMPQSPPAMPQPPPAGAPRSPGVRRNRSPRAASAPRLVRALC